MAIRRSHLLRTLLVIACLSTTVSRTVAGDGSADVRVYEPGQRPNDRRLEPQKDLNGHFPFKVPASRSEWEARADSLRRRILVSTGLWPRPRKTPLNAVIHGRVERDGFTVEKVYFESVPDHFVTGLLFRPVGVSGRRAGILSPHGHGGRLQDYGAAKMPQLIADGAELFEASGRFPKLARCAHLARMGCVVFIYDMLGYADSVQISRTLAHRYSERRPEYETPENWGFFSTQAELRMQSIMGLQTWNSVRALDFLASLPDVDADRLAVTGGSGGGTQTILLGAIDRRPKAAFPQGMVSTAMQGGCTCENCSLLRIGTGNVELAGLFAPRPQAMTAANDWTRAMMTDGYPELERLYSLYGAPKNVQCTPQLHFPHNFNSVTRGLMYAWFNKHLNLGQADLQERDYRPLSAEEYTVWNQTHPKPQRDPDYERRLLRQLWHASERQMKKLMPSDAASLDQYREVVGGAWETLLHRSLPVATDIQRTKVAKDVQADHIRFKDILRLQPEGEEFPVISLYPTNTPWNKQVVVWVDGRGKSGLFDASGAPVNDVQRLLNAGFTVVAADLMLQGDFLVDGQPLAQTPVVANPREFAGYTFTYNDTLFVQRTHDLLTLVSWVANDDHQAERILAVGVNGGGSLLAAARTVTGETISRAAIDTGGFRFTSLNNYRDPLFVPGAVKYGDLPGLLSLSAPAELWIGGEDGKTPDVVSACYEAAGGTGRLATSSRQDTVSAAVDWLLEE